MNFNAGGADNQAQLHDHEMDFFTEEEIQNGDYREIPDEVIFLVHLTPSIFKASSSGKTPILEALKGFSSFLKSKIISNSKDKVGLVFYNSP